MRRSVLAMMLAGPLLLGGCTIHTGYVQTGYPVQVGPMHGHSRWVPPPAVRVHPVHPAYRAPPRHVRPHPSWGHGGYRHPSHPADRRWGHRH